MGEPDYMLVIRYIVFQVVVKEGVQQKGLAGTTDSGNNLDKAIPDGMDQFVQIGLPFVHFALF